MANPTGRVTITPDTAVCIYGGKGNECHAAGEETTMLAAHAAHLSEPMVVSPESAQDECWLVTIPAGGDVELEFEASMQSMLIESTVPLLYVDGTESVPLVKPTEPIIKENAPDLLQAGETTKSLTKDGEPVTSAAIINCEAVDTKVKLTIKGG